MVLSEEPEELNKALEVNAESEELSGVEEKEAQDIVIVKMVICQEVIGKIEKETEKAIETNENHIVQEVLDIVVTKTEEVKNIIENLESTIGNLESTIGNLENTKEKVQESTKEKVQESIREKVQEKSLITDLSVVLEVDTGMKDKMIDLPEVTMEMCTNLQENEKITTTATDQAEEVIENQFEEEILEDTVTTTSIRDQEKVTLLLAN